MIRFAVTGGIACGKSTFGRLLADSGVCVADTDDIVRGLHAPGGKASAFVASAFGPEYIAGDGSTNRPRLADLVFSDDSARRRLEEFVHPLVRGVLLERIASASGSFAAFAALVPLLFQTDLGIDWDCTVTVECAPEEQLRRLLLRGGTLEQAKARIAAQMSADERRARADFSIENDGSPAELAALTENFLKNELPNFQKQTKEYTK